MPILPIITGASTPILRTKTKPVPKITKAILGLVADMAETMVAAKGAGLAAPQVSRTERICIAMIGGKLTPLINPVVTWKSEAIEVAEEGCLSLPEIWLQIPRSVEIIVTFLSPEGKKRELKLEHFDARVVQHEVDHLEGKLIVDYAQSKVTGHHEKPL
ncbi:MAG: peptide deformylase [Candidatus Peribacteraceae bacterium]|nr:peptide deformylase [Candidatus Peribacteraceae bacterium]